MTPTSQELEDLLWSDGFGGSLVDGLVQAVATYNGDMIAGGYFRAAGGVPGSSFIARWDGTSWNAMGNNEVGNGDVNREVLALAVYNGELYAGGLMVYSGGAPSDDIVRWDGTSWHAVGTGTNSSVRTLLVRGNDLLAGGDFTEAGGVPASGVARWNGTSWSPLGSGLNGTVTGLAEYHGDLFAAGSFASSGTTSVNNIARWDGSTWSDVGTGINGIVRGLAATEQALYAGGSFTSAGGVPGTAYIAQWDSTSWQPLGTGVNYEVNALATRGDTLIAGGHFTVAGGLLTKGIARWDGSSWEALGSGVDNEICCAQASVEALAFVGDTLVAGGRFTAAGGIEANNLALWDGTTWSGEISSSGAGVSGTSQAVASYDGSLVVGGSFGWAGGGTRVDHIARWDGATWSPLGTGVNGDVFTLTVHDGDIIAGGTFTQAGGMSANRIARWDGSQWHALGSGTNNSVLALTTFNGDLYAGGKFTVAGGQPANYVARWDGVSWSALGSGIGGVSFTQVEALAVHDSALVVGGEFDTAGGSPANAIARWDGVTWSTFGSGFAAADNGGYPYDPVVFALETYEGDLVAGGNFTEADGESARFVARWDGMSWHWMRGITTIVWAMEIYGNSLFVGGAFTPAHMAFWDGDEWKYLGSGTNNWILDLTEHDGSLFPVGTFETAGQNPSIHVARWTPNRTGIRDVVSPVIVSAYPNPFRSSTTLLYELKHPGLVHLAVFDVQGRRVATLVEGYQAAGPYRQTWAGLDRFGNRLPSGVYYLRLRSGGQKMIQSVILAR